MNQAIRKLQITITAVKREWCDVTVHGYKDFYTRVQKNMVVDLPLNQRIEIFGYVNIKHNRFGSSHELIIRTPDEFEQQKKEILDAEIEKWIEKFRDKYKYEDYFYERAVQELHDLGCHDFDDEIKEAEIGCQIKRFRNTYNIYGYIDRKSIQELHNLDCHDFDDEIRMTEIQYWFKRFLDKYNNYDYIDRKSIQELHNLDCHDLDEDIKEAEIGYWIKRFRDNYKRISSFDKESVLELHKLGCHDFDDEINEIDAERWIGYFRDNYDNGNGYIYNRAITELHTLNCHKYDAEIEAAKNTIDIKKRKAEERGIDYLYIEAYKGFDGRPPKGDIIVHNERAYIVISSFYNKENGLSYGLKTDEWYFVKAKYIGDIKYRNF